MRYSPILILIIFFVACSTRENENNTPAQNASVPIKQISKSISDNDSNWQTYVDTINTEFTMSFSHPKTLFAEHFENSVCIGKKIKIVENGPATTMDCSIWMDDPSEGYVKPIDTLIRYVLEKSKTEVEPVKDTINIANTKAIRVQFLSKADKSVVITQLITFNKYETSFEIYNDSLSPRDFVIFTNSLKIEK